MFNRPAPHGIPDSPRLSRRAAHRLIEQRLIGETNLDRPDQRRDRWVRALDPAVVADHLDALQIVGIGDLRRDDIAELRSLAGDRALERAKAGERQRIKRADDAGGAGHLALGNQVDLRRDQAGALHGPAELVDDAACVEPEERHVGHADLDREARQRPAARLEDVGVDAGGGSGGGGRAKDRL